MKSAILDKVDELLGAGLVPLPLGAGSKAPSVPWREYIGVSADAVDAGRVRANFGADPTGVGFLTGRVEMLEFEGRAMRLIEGGGVRDALEAAGLDGVWARMCMWVERSPSGGTHFFYLTESPHGNEKIASGEDRSVLIETRGLGGFVVVSPTGASHGTTCAGWSTEIGGPECLVEVSDADRGRVFDILREFDCAPRKNTTPQLPITLRVAEGKPAGGSAVAEWEAATGWPAILGPHGWTVVSEGGGGELHWCRPGKRGTISATTGSAEDRDRLYVFSTSTPFQSEVPYTKFGAHTLLNYGGESSGDFSRAARDLYDDGYGERTTAEDLYGGGLTWDEVAPEVPDVVESTSAALYGSDDWVAAEFVTAHADRIRFCPERREWLTWTGSRWQWDTSGRVRHIAREFARGMSTRDYDEDHTISSRTRFYWSSTRGVDAIVKFATSDPRAVAHLDTIDADGHVLNTPAGIVDLRTGGVREPSPDSLCVRSTTVAPDLDMATPMWDNFLAQTFAGAPEVTGFMQRLLGVAMCGVVYEQVLPFAHGAGANGKTTLLSVIQHLVGVGDEGYSISAQSEVLMASNSSQHPTVLAQLAGARLVVTSELEDGEKFAEARVKQLTGKDTISARFMRGDFFSFAPSHTLFLLANHQPEVKSGGTAFWRRIRMIPFNNTVPKSARILDLEERLISEEGPGILAWLVRGAVEYFTEGGLREPQAVLAATDAYEHEQDTVKKFVEERCTLGSPAVQGMTVASAALYNEYKNYCTMDGENPVSHKTFTQRLKTGWDIQQTRSSSQRFYEGIRLVQDDTMSDREDSSGNRFGW